jgi:peptide/nickel transport system substrate-binding protein
MKIAKRLLVPANLLLILLTIGVLLTMSCSGGATTTSPTTSIAPTSTPAITQNTNAPTSSATTTTTATSKPTATTTAAGAAVPSGTLRVAMPGLEDETFLPWNGAAGRKFYLDTIYEYLIYMDPATRLPVPGLAKSWSNSADGKTWTVNLRQGVQFQENYGELTSDDVKFTFERQMAPTSKASQASNFRDYNLTISTPDKYTAVFNINKPDFTFWNRLGNNVGNSIVCKNTLNKQAMKSQFIHRTGAFTLAELKRGTVIKVTAVRAENHWRVRPAFKDIVFYGVPEESTQWLCCWPVRQTWVYKP